MLSPELQQLKGFYLQLLLTEIICFICYLPKIRKKWAPLPSSRGRGPLNTEGLEGLPWLIPLSSDADMEKSRPRCLPLKKEILVWGERLRETVTPFRNATPPASASQEQHRGLRKLIYFLPMTSSLSVVVMSKILSFKIKFYCSAHLNHKVK